MNKKLQKVIEDSKRIAAERSARRAKLQEGIALAEQELQKVGEDKQSAIDAAAYADAAERERRTADMLEYYEAAMKDAEKNMTQAEYDDKKAVIRKCATEATDSFRAKAEKITAQLVTAYNEYAQAMAEVNGAAEDLDEASQLLQEQYGEHWRMRATRYRIGEQEELYLARENNNVAADTVRLRTWKLLSALMGWHE